MNLIEILNDNHITYTENEPMSSHTTFKIGGAADIMITAENIDGLKAALAACKVSDTPFMILGNGSNLLVSDDGIEGAVILLDGDFKAISVDGEVITAPMDSGTILPGITRDSVICLLKKWGVPVSERKLAIDDVFAAQEAGKLEEVFASGTAAVISPIGTLNYNGEDHPVADGCVGPLAQKLYDTLYGIQTGAIDDFMGWTCPLGLKAGQEG